MCARYKKYKHDRVLFTTNLQDPRIKEKNLAIHKFILFQSATCRCPNDLIIKTWHSISTQLLVFLEPRLSIMVKTIFFSIMAIINASSWQCMNIDAKTYEAKESQYLGILQKFRNIYISIYVCNAIWLYGYQQASFHPNSVELIRYIHIPTSSSGYQLQA